MAGARRVLILGGSGVFGRLLAAEALATTDADLLIAGRDEKKAAQACRGLKAGTRVEPVAFDLAEGGAFAEIASGCDAVACAAGPFPSLPRDLPALAVDAGAHWLYISDDSGWVMPLLADRALYERAQDANLAVMPGLSSVPALSGALVRWGAQRVAQPRRARVTLYIGNRNEKGPGAIASAIAGHFRSPARVDLPVGVRSAWRFDSPDADLLKRDLRLDGEFRVVLQSRMAGPIVAGLGGVWPLLGEGARDRLLRTAVAVSKPFSVLGDRTGIVQAEVWGSADSRAAIAASGDQRLAILPCAFALQDLLAGRSQPPGSVDPATWLQPGEWVDRLRGAGVRVFAAEGSSAQG